MNIKEPLTHFRVHGRNDSVINADLQSERKTVALWKHYTTQPPQGFTGTDDSLYRLFKIISKNSGNLETHDLLTILNQKPDDLISLFRRGFLLERFIFTQIKKSLFQKKFSYLVVLIRILSHTRVESLQYVRYYFTTVLPVILKNRRTVLEFKKKRWI
jgi:hypothetical protein